MARTQLWAAPPPSAVDDLLDVEPGLDGEDDALRDAEVGAGEDDLVDGLDRLAGADRSDMGDRPAHRRQHRAGALDVRRVAADEDRQRRLLGALAAARRPAHRPSRCRAPRSRAAKSQLPDGAIVEQSMTRVPGTSAGDDAVRTEQDGLDVRRVRDADDDDVRLGDGRRRATRPSTTPSSAELRARPGVRFQPVTGKPARARLAAIAAPIVPSPRKATGPRCGPGSAVIGRDGWTARIDLEMRRPGAPSASSAGLEA